MGETDGGNYSTSIITALYYIEIGTFHNNNISPINLPTSLDQHEPTFSTLTIVGAVLIVCILSPIIICGNLLLLGAFYRFKRLRTPSNYLIASLASSDMLMGLFLPLALYIELTKYSSKNVLLCLLPFSLLISLGNASLCAMAAIAADRFTSLAQPLRYNNLITPTSVERYIFIFCFYSIILGFSPFYYIDDDNFNQQCSFSCINKTIQIILFSCVYCPCALIVLVCYGYIYVVARYHARAIYSVELSLRQQDNPLVEIPHQVQQHNSVVSVTNHSRYGQTLALTVGLFLSLWLPFIISMLLDIISADILILSQQWMTAGLALPIFINSAINPWIYGYHNTEVRLAIIRVFDEILIKLRLNRKESIVVTSYRETALIVEMNSCVSNTRLPQNYLNDNVVAGGGGGTTGRSLLIPRRDTIECSTIGSAAKETVVHLELPSLTAQQLFKNQNL